MRYIPLLVAGQAVGLMMPEFAAALLGAGDDVFELRRGDDETNGGIGETTNGADGGDGADTNGKAYSNVVTGDERKNLLAAPESMLSDSKKKKLVVTLDHANAMTAPQRTETVKPILERLKTQNVITGWRDELFPVNKNYGEPPLLLVERASASLLGIKAYGVHVNGFVSDPSNGRVSKIWVARRSATKQTFPGMLDHLVAGGLPANMDPGECCVKECEEEASIPLVLARKAQPVGLVTYSSNYKGCCKRDVLFCYDLELPYVMGLSPNPASLFAHMRLTLSFLYLSVARSAGARRFWKRRRSSDLFRAANTKINSPRFRKRTSDCPPSWISRKRSVTCSRRWCPGGHFGVFQRKRTAVRKIAGRIRCRKKDGP
jgi:hypothetical protein